jgi:hypothetical protein
MNAEKTTLCQSSFPIEVDPMGWQGRGKCKVDSINADVFITLIKVE